ncbi:MAG TPA: phospho-N-acetylmuramoyl-pentapeptide-transferase [Candidatus Ornithomonoglobus merdipullorum]|uniref:Phospho-N-acetylmuramoyl-pentapeptide-transferase n=1 Tax=Candidatus Ornithomonoglobus merdipullorum TaxID=2840895 RepID=A0A9D1MD16_9FIRM|nr:phospho-N-acetylmuramoyl-pentapeptide-transferase [Candidatus Ornithomonoglobus merdipullorum]
MAVDFLKATLFALVVAFAVTAVLGPAFIKWLHRLKYGQEIREEGPSWHKKKSGTPTMGGIMFIVGIAVAVAAGTVIMAVNGTLNGTAMKAVVLFAVSLGFGVIGFIDDYIKVVKKRNLGLTAIQKFVLQLVFAAIYVVVMYFMGLLETDIVIPFVKYTVTIPIWLYIPFVMFVVVGTVNAVNLTDGLDGLASSVTVVVGLFFALYSFFRSDPSETGVSMYAMALVGGLLAFLIYNKYPAKVFMGDTGSLFLGGSVSLMAVDLNMHIYLILVGFVYFAETLSVILQTTYFKYTKKKYGEGRRIFKMTPIHHHFEMMKWKETKIVSVFTLVTLVLCVISYFA